LPESGFRHLPEPDVRKQNWSAAKQVYQFFVDKKEEYCPEFSGCIYHDVAGSIRG